MKNFKCPFCKQKMTLGKSRKYETLIEHVSDPNLEDVPLRETYVCSCEKSQNYYWNFMGEVYTINFESKTFRKYSDLSAINSISYKVERDRKREEFLNKFLIYRIYKIIRYFLLRRKLLLKYKINGKEVPFWLK